MSDSDEGAAGFLDQSTTSSEYNAFFFQVMGILAGNNFNIPVKVIAVQSAGELAMTGLLDVQPMINQVTGEGVSIPHETIHGVPYLRMQGGTNAVIMDPVVGDIGMMMCADKDVSAVKNTKDISNPGSARVHDYADGIYIGGMLNGIPTQYIQFNSGGIEMHSPAKIKLTAPVIEITATTSITEAAPNIAMNASTRVATTAPDVKMDTTTIEVTASTSVTTTTPNFSVVGAVQISGLTSLNGGFAAQPISGGGASTINSAVNVTGQTTLAGVTAGGKNIGGTHTHTAVQPGSGTSGGPT